MNSQQIQSVAAKIFGENDQPKEGKLRLLYEAINLFYRRGFNAVGVDQVIQAAGVSKTTFYKHFESKDELVLEAVQFQDAWEQGVWCEAVKELAGDDPKQQLIRYFDVLDVWFNDERFNGCVFINAATEFPDPNDPIHKAAVAAKLKMRQHVRDQAEAAGLEDVDAFADVYMVLAEGTLVYRHTYERDEAARLARPMVETLVERHTPAAA